MPHGTETRRKYLIPLSNNYSGWASQSTLMNGKKFATQISGGGGGGGGGLNSHSIACAATAEVCKKFGWTILVSS